MNPDPEKLLDLARAGDAQALGAVLELYRNYLTLLARSQVRRRVRGKIDASDVVQETFLAAHRDFASFRGSTESAFMCWLRAILAARLTDVVHRYFGAQRRDVRLERDLAEDLERSSHAIGFSLAARGSSPSEQASRRERAVLLADALHQLPPDYEEVVVLRHLEGLTFPEVAQHMGRSLDSVEKLWVRALARLRGVLEGIV